MKLVLCAIIPLLSVFASGVTPASAQTLAADYQLQSVYTSSAGMIGPLTTTGQATGVGFTTDTVLGQSQQVLKIQTSNTSAPFVEGGVQTQTNPFLSSSNYSAVLLASFQISTADVAATKVMDFRNLSSDAGLYVNDATGLLAFYDGSSNLLGTSTSPFVSGQYVQITLTRDSSTNLVTVYANSTAQFSFTDSTGLAILGDKTNTGSSYLSLFQDDGTGIGGTVIAEGTLGNIARLRLYDGALSAAQIGSLPVLAPVPEGSTNALLLIGGASVCALVSRRKSYTRQA